MEPKSIAFYTAVAVSILAVISATTFPTLALATTQADEELQEQAAQADNESATDETEPEEVMTDETEPEEEKNNSANRNDNGATSQSLGLATSSGVASCGQIVREDVTLTSDLTCGDGDGLIVGASGITINLNGYSISSSDETDSTDLTMDYDGNSGILVANAENVAISGLGEISGFDEGVTFIGSSRGQVTDLQLADNGIGVLMSGSEETEISRNTITNNGFAVVSDSSNGAVVAFNQVVANLEQGIVLLGSATNMVVANNMFGNGDNGIYLDAQSTGNTIDYNTAFGHETADMNNANGLPTSVNQNSFGENNNCGTSLPGGLCS